MDFNNDILKPERNMFWTSHGYGLPKYGRVSCARWAIANDLRYAYTADDIKRAVTQMLDAERRGIDAWMETCSQIEDDYTFLIDPIAHLRKQGDNKYYEVIP